MKRILSLFFVIVLALGSSFSQTVDEILENYFENTGGLEAHKSMKSMKVTGKMPTPQGDFEFIAYRKAPNLIRVELDIQGKLLVPQAYDGTTAWTINPFIGGEEPQKLPEDEAKEVVDDADFEDSFIDYKEKGHEVNLEGNEEIDGVDCFKIKLVKNKNNDKEEVTSYYFFDTENFVPIMIRSTAKSGPQKGAVMDQYVSDYEEVEGGVILPHYFEVRIGGQIAHTLVFEEYLINEEIDDEVFAFPESSEL